jgi:hypothetical protein
MKVEDKVIELIKEKNVLQKKQDAWSKQIDRLVGERIIIDSDLIRLEKRIKEEGEKL